MVHWVSRPLHRKIKEGEYLTNGKTDAAFNDCLPFIFSAYSKKSALAELKVEAEKSVLGCSVLQNANLALSTTLISQQHCLQFQTQTGEMGLRSKVAQGLNLT